MDPQHQVLFGPKTPSWFTCEDKTLEQRSWDCTSDNTTSVQNTKGGEWVTKPQIPEPQCRLWYTRTIGRGIPFYLGHQDALFFLGKVCFIILEK